MSTKSLVTPGVPKNKGCAGVRQLALLPAGCQPWNLDVCDASGDRFAYCATLAIYIYQLDPVFHEFRLHSIMSEHSRTISCVRWHPQDVDLLASASSDQHVILWHVSEQRVVARLDRLRETPVCLGFVPSESTILSFVAGTGPLYLWNYNATKFPLPFHKEAQGFSSPVRQFKWHHKQPGKMVFGHQNGTLSFFHMGKRSCKHVLRPLDSSGEEIKDSENEQVVALQWDPLSTEYLLVARALTGVELVDADALSVLQRFRLPSAAATVRTLAWVDSAPGMFLTGDATTGVMRIWSVAKSAPLENLKLKKTGFHALHVFTAAPGSSSDGSDSSSGAYVMPTMSPAGRYALPPAYAVCAFMDGGVGLYDLGKRRWFFLRDQGHVETIFDCKFKPESAEFLATASFDGTIKIWDVNTLTSVQCSPGNEGVIYCLSWAPADLNCVVASTAEKGAFIWDLRRDRVITRFKEHGEGVAVYCVAWNQKDSRLIASCGADKQCIVRQVDGQVVARFRHPAPVFGCDWNPNYKDMLVSGCEDKLVRVWYLVTAKSSSNNNSGGGGESPLKVFSGHAAKVFNVRWSPLRDGLLCSGSDDGTVRVWDYSHEGCVLTLHGHTAPVRGLLWSSEISYLLVTGSWDATLRVWDVRSGECLVTVSDHGADVYGLTSHPDRPFLLASSSRDSTVRLWSVSGLMPQLELSLLAARPWDDFIASPEQPMAPDSGPLLCGKRSKELKTELDRLSDGRAKTLQSFLQFFSGCTGSGNLWELVRVLQGMNGSGLSQNYSRGIMHIQHLLKFKSGDAQELELVRNFRQGGAGQRSRDDKLREAAELYVRVGNVHKYCELLGELGEWDKALALAPAVSMDYWMQLTERRLTALKQDDSEQLIPYAVAVGDVNTLVQHFTGRGQLQDAMLAATAGYEGMISRPQDSGGVAATNGVNHSEEESGELLTTTCLSLADWHLATGNSVSAACCHLAISDAQGAVSKLLRGNELELAAGVSMVLGSTPQLLQLTAEYLARRCERIGNWELGVDVLKLAGDSELARARLCVRCGLSGNDRNQLYKRAGFPDTDQCLEAAQRCGDDVLKTVMYCMLSPEPERSLQAGLQYVRERLGRQKWTLKEVWDVAQMMAAIPTEKLHTSSCGKYRGELVILCSYLGALVALRRRYYSIVLALFKNTLTLMKKEPESQLPLSESAVAAEVDAVRGYLQENTLKTKSDRRQWVTSPQQKEVIEQLLRRAGPEPSPMEPGEDVVTASTLPCHSDIHKSFFTGHRIQGPAFVLEDGKSALAVSEALMWAKVMPFSPLGTHVTINPF